ncbi:MAG: hypothetical protein IMZ62_18520, partial [Chloroflexi bacterium]|nr:hypothetical protein [Chloroflexota bacterium]
VYYLRQVSTATFTVHLTAAAANAGTGKLTFADAGTGLHTCGTATQYVYTDIAKARQVAASLGLPLSAQTIISWMGNNGYDYSRETKTVVKAAGIIAARGTTAEARFNGPNFCSEQSYGGLFGFQAYRYNLPFAEMHGETAFGLLETKIQQAKAFHLNLLLYTHGTAAADAYQLTAVQWTTFKGYLTTYVDNDHLRVCGVCDALQILSARPGPFRCDEAGTLYYMDASGTPLKIA